MTKLNKIERANLLGEIGKGADFYNLLNCIVNYDGQDKTKLRRLDNWRSYMENDQIYSNPVDNKNWFSNTMFWSRDFKGFENPYISLNSYFKFDPILSLMNENYIKQMSAHKATFVLYLVKSLLDISKSSESFDKEYDIASMLLSDRYFDIVEYTVPFRIGNVISSYNYSYVTEKLYTIDNLIREQVKPSKDNISFEGMEEYGNLTDEYKKSLKFNTYGKLLKIRKENSNEEIDEFKEEIFKFKHESTKSIYDCVDEFGDMVGNIAAEISERFIRFVKTKLTVDYSDWSAFYKNVKLNITSFSSKKDESKYSSSVVLSDRGDIIINLLISEDLANDIKFFTNEILKEYDEDQQIDYILYLMGHKTIETVLGKITWIFKELKATNMSKLHMEFSWMYCNQEDTKNMFEKLNKDDSYYDEEQDEINNTFRKDAYKVAYGMVHSLHYLGHYDVILDRYLDAIDEAIDFVDKRVAYNTTEEFTYNYLPSTTDDREEDYEGKTIPSHLINFKRMRKFFKKCCKDLLEK